MTTEPQWRTLHARPLVESKTLCALTFRVSDEEEYTVNYYDMAPPVPELGSLVMLNVAEWGAPHDWRTYRVLTRVFGYAEQVLIATHRMTAWVDMTVEPVEDREEVDDRARTE